APGNPPFFDLTTLPEAASCRACRVIGKAVWIPKARRHVFIHLDNLLPQRARRPFGLRPAPLFYYLPLSQESEARADAGRPIRKIAGRDRAVAYLQRSLCGREIAALSQQIGLPARSFANPSAGRFDRRHA